jgi:hypothetical protein
MMKMMNYMRQ